MDKETPKLSEDTIKRMKSMGLDPNEMSEEQLAALESLERPEKSHWLSKPFTYIGGFLELMALFSLFSADWGAVFGYGIIGLILMYIGYRIQANIAGKKFVQASIKKHMQKEEKRGIPKMFENLRNHSLLEIQEAAKLGNITNFEEKAFISFCAAANIAAQTYLTSEKLPYNRIEKVEDENTVLDAYFFLCAIELHGFFARLKNKKEISEALDVPKERLVKDFAAIFGGEELENYLNKLLTAFDKMVKEMGGDPRDLWYNQALLFGNKLSEGKIDFGDLTEKDLAAKLSISLVSQNLQIESAKLFDSIVFNKDEK